MEGSGEMVTCEPRDNTITSKIFSSPSSSHFISVKLLHSSLLSRLHPNYNWSPQQVKAWFPEETLPTPHFKDKASGHCGNCPSVGSENEDRSPAAAGPVTVTICFTVCICAQVHRRCEVFLHYVIIGYNYRLCPC